MYLLVNVQNKLCGTQVGGINMDQGTYWVIDSLIAGYGPDDWYAET